MATSGSGEPNVAQCLFCSHNASNTWRGKNNKKERCRIPGAANCELLDRQLQRIFIVRELLEISEEHCLRFLRGSDDGASGNLNPEEWFNICEYCMREKVWKAWEIHQRLTALQLEMDIIRKEIQERMRQHLAEASFQFYGVESEVSVQIKRLIFPYVKTVSKPVDTTTAVKSADIKLEIHDDNEYFMESITNYDDTEYLPPAISPEPSCGDMDGGDSGNLDSLADDSDEFVFPRITKKLGGHIKTRTRVSDPPHLTTTTKGTNRKHKKRKKPLNRNPSIPCLTVTGTLKTYKKRSKRLGDDLYISKYGELKEKTFHWNACKKCPSKFRNEDEFQAHMELHEEREKAGFGSLDCKICRFPAISSDQLAYHMNRHETVKIKKVYNCMKCSFKCKLWKNLKHHVDKEHPGLTEEELDELGLLLKCPVCDREFGQLRNLNVHKRTEHPELFGHKKERLQCEQCNVIFNSKISLQSHILSAHKIELKYVCETCGRRFRYYKKLESHKKSHENSKREFICHVCGCECRYKSTLDAHYKKFHAELLDPCEENGCGVSTPSPSKKMLKCNYCEMITQFPSVLKEHIKTHKETMGHRCKLCARCYVNSQGLKRHMKLNHSAVVVDVPCPHCLKVFTSVDYMKDHVTKYCRMKTL